MVPFKNKILLTLLIFFLPIRLFTQYQNYRFENLNSDDGLSENSVVIIFQDSRQFLWFGTFNGLNRYDGYSFKVFKSEIEDSTTISGSTISSICEDRNGNLRIGTTVGLFKLNRIENDSDNFQFIHYSTKDGLPDNNIQGIVEDDDHNIWISTNKGISKLVIGKMIFKNFNMNNGLPSDEFYVNSIKKLKNTGELLFGGVKGFTIFHPDLIKDDYFITPVVFTDFRISNRPVPIG